MANRLSDIFNPYYSSSPFFLLVAAGASQSIGSALAYWAVLTLFFSALPMWDIRRRIRLGAVQDAHISAREDRIKPFLFSLSCAVFGLVAVYVVGAPAAIKAVSWTIVLVGAAITAITSVWKVSLHAAAIAAIVTVLTALYGAIAVPSILLVPVVVWARLTLKKHTPAQLAVGILVAAAIASAVLARFGMV